MESPCTDAIGISPSQPKPIVVKNMKLPIGDQQPDAKDVPLALEDGNPNSSSDSSSDSDSSSSSSEEDAPMENSSDSSDKDKQQSCKKKLSQASLLCMRLRKVCSVPRRNCRTPRQ